MVASFFFFVFLNAMRPITVLYILVIYVVFQFCWWAYLLIELNTEVYTYKTEIVRLTNVDAGLANELTNQLDAKITQRKRMVLGEGMVFLSLLVWGSVITYRSFRRDYELARLQKNFLLSVTHEFKSPLASIKLYLETLQKHDLEKEKEKKFIRSALQDTERLNGLVENALMANLIDHSGHLLSQDHLNLSALIKKLVQRFETIPGFPTIHLNLKEDIEILGDQNALCIMVNNLIENAAKYTPDKSPIYISLSCDAKNVKLTVADLGICIPDDEKEKVFQKFYRSGNEETRSSKGTGLGLYLVRHIVSKHDGTVAIKNNSPKGSVFEVTLKCASS